MATSEAQRKAIYKYQHEKIKRIPLDVRKEYYFELKQAADNAGESVNMYIKKAIAMRIEQERR